MSLPEAEKRREKRRSSDVGDRGDESGDEDDRAAGVTLVAAVAFLGGAADFLSGAALLPTPLFAIGVPLATFGAVKCWAAVGLHRRRVRALGVAVLLYGVTALFAAGRLIFAVGIGGPFGWPVGRLGFNLLVVGYLLAVADRFERPE
ncbi:MAG: hypothetical protein R6U01_10465 [Halorubrum sp.]|uniref:hypothetical protein n=1 Tax=Halorubrum sp. TaxID=1879286 RepID=UPI003970BCDF